MLVGRAWGFGGGAPNPQAPRPKPISRHANPRPWAFPLLVKFFPRHYTALALLSVQNLIFAILWGSYHYGGASSPFLMWLLVVPLPRQSARLGQSFFQFKQHFASIHILAGRFNRKRLARSSRFDF